MNALTDHLIQNVDPNLLDRQPPSRIGQFVSNSFTKDQFGGGMEVSFRETLVVRLGYMWEPGIGSEQDKTSAFTGPAAGFTLNIPSNSDGGVIGIDYGYRATNPFNGNHSIGIHITI